MWCGGLCQVNIISVKIEDENWFFKIPRKKNI